MLTSFKFEGIPGLRNIHHHLNPDMNILTGRNGSGKTTVLKLLWYLTSGNIEVALSEVPFSRAVVETTDYIINVERVEGGAKILIQIGDDEIPFEEEDDEEFSVDNVGAANDFSAPFGSSIFFPTFRRIEGGFTLRSSGRPRFPPSGILTNARQPRIAIDEALASLSSKLTVEGHTFVASLSTGDVVNVLLKKYNEATEEANRLQSQESESIINRIKQHKRAKDELRDADLSSGAENLIDNIQLTIESLEKERSRLFASINEINQTITSLFKKKGIALGSRLNFGDAANAISSDLLSAGEKQMLSFLCYNALRDEASIFIDEPELSLHIDWQRQLFPLLFKQKVGNQFIIATHSPFIYSKYPEKEIVLSEDKGE